MYCVCGKQQPFCYGKGLFCLFLPEMQGAKVSLLSLNYSKCLVKVTLCCRWQNYNVCFLAKHFIGGGKESTNSLFPLWGHMDTFMLF